MLPANWKTYDAESMRHAHLNQHCALELMVWSKARWRSSTHSYRLWINCWQKSNSQYSQDSLQYCMSLPQTAKRSQLFPSALTNVQALELCSTGRVEEGVFFAKEGRAETVTVLSLLSWGLGTYRNVASVQQMNSNKISSNGFIIHEDKSLWRNKPRADVKQLFNQ